jgi:hypothetical protein
MVERAPRRQPARTTEGGQQPAGMSPRVGAEARRPQDPLTERCAKLIPGFHGYEASLIIDEKNPDRAWFAHNLAGSVLAGTAQFGTVDPESQRGRELTALVTELAPAAERIATRWEVEKGSGGGGN